jgi:hypothetical protein
MKSDIIIYDNLYKKSFKKIKGWKVFKIKSQFKIKIVATIKLNQQNIA